MSDMRRYIGTYSYTGKFRESQNGIDFLEISEFTYNGKYYKPSEPLKLVITPRPEEGGWLSVRCEEAGVIIGGVGLKEALGNAFMMAACQYDDLTFLDDDQAVHVRELRDRFRKWEVHAIDSKAQ